VVIAAV